jgi:hypothetical protein
MALTLIKEDGTGLANANSYASATDGNAYHEGHLYATAWNGATTGQKEAALVMATRLIDGEFQFFGFRAVEGQALQWPRVECPDADEITGFVAEDIVPRIVVDAVCDLARFLIQSDRTAAHPGEGLTYSNDGALQVGYNKQDIRPLIPKHIQAWLARYAEPRMAKSGSVRVVRV